MSRSSEEDSIPANFAEELLQHLDALYSYAIVLTRNKQLAGDLVQETYVHALRFWQKYTLDTNLKAWMFTILRNIWLNQYHREHNGPQFITLFDENNEESRVTLPSTDNNPETDLLRSIRIQQIREAIEHLPEPYREIIVLRDLDGFSYREIAIILECAEGTVMSRLNRARQKLRSILLKVI